MPKLAMINTVCTGSHGRIMADLRHAAECSGFQAAVYFGRGGSAGPGCTRFVSRGDVLSHVALTRTLDRHARGSRRSSHALVRALAAFSPDVLHLHNLHGYYLNAEVLFDYIRDHAVPTVWTLHDCWAFTGHCSHFVRASCDRWIDGCHHCPLVREYPASFGLDASAANWIWKRETFAKTKTLNIVTPSRWLDAMVGQSFLKDIPRAVIPNGVDLESFSVSQDKNVRHKFGVQDGQAMLLAVAAPFDARKGFADALRVAETLGGNARVVLVGLEDRQMRNLPGNVTGVMRTGSPLELVSLYGAADCLINPTYEDTYPTVNMEAMACGTPVAAYAVGGCVEQLETDCGRLVSCGDADALAQAAMELAARKGQLRQACRVYAEEHFDRKRAVESYVALYRKLTGE